MRYFLLFLLSSFVVYTPNTAFSQNNNKILLKRTDRIGDKDHFVTVGEEFSVEVLLVGSQNVSQVSFELYIGNGGSAQFSRFEGSDFTNVSPAPREIREGNDSRIIVNAYVAGNPNTDFIDTNDAPDRRYANGDTIFVTELFFVVNSNATHNNFLQAQFLDANVTSYTGSGSEVLRLNSTPSTYAIRGEIDVYPGDANNDGIVNANDFAAIAQYVGNGRSTDPIRGFVRTPQSILWSPQKARAWDSIPATYSDCNGDGRVSVLDYVVVMNNFDRTSAIERDDRTNPDGLARGFFPPDISRNHTIVNNKNRKNQSQSSVFFPVKIQTDEMVSGFTMELSWKQFKDSYRVLGISKGTSFTGAEFYSNIDEENHFIEFGYAYFKGEQSSMANGTVAFLEVQPINKPTQNFCPEVELIQGIKNNDLTTLTSSIDCSTVTSIENSYVATSMKLPVLSPNPVQDLVTIRNLESIAGAVNVKVMNVLGRQVLARTVNVPQSKGFRITLPVSTLSRGKYYIVLEQNGHRQTLPFTIDR